MQAAVKLSPDTRLSLSNMVEVTKESALRAMLARARAGDDALGVVARLDQKGLIEDIEREVSPTDIVMAATGPGGWSMATRSASTARDSGLPASTRPKWVSPE